MIVLRQKIVNMPIRTGDFMAMTNRIVHVKILLSKNKNM